jgi:hypothetical protein
MRKRCHVLASIVMVGWLTPFTKKRFEARLIVDAKQIRDRGRVTT